jgi:hypothetical protein
MSSLPLSELRSSSYLQPAFEDRRRRDLNVRRERDARRYLDGRREREA